MTASRPLTRGIFLGASGIAASLCVAFAVPAADETAPVPKPDVKVGDSWTYRVTTYASNVPQAQRAETRVTFASADVIVTVDRWDGGQERDSQFTAEWNAVSLGSGAVYDRPNRQYKFPLTVGESFPYSHETSFRGSPARSKSEGTVKVVGWEDVVVPAGRFRALKIEARGAYQRLDIRQGAPQRTDIWYAPAVKRLVKLVYEDGPPGRDPENKRMLELTDFKLQ